MDASTRLVIACSGAAFLRGAISTIWQKYKRRHAERATPLRYSNGTYVPWGPVQKWQFFGNSILITYGIFVLLVIAGLTYRWLE